MKKSTKITTAIISIILAVIMIAIIAIITTPAAPNGPVQKYGTEAVRVLEKYKNFDINAKEAAIRLGDLRDLVKKEKDATTDEEEEHKLLMLWLDLLDIHSTLYHKGSATGYEIDETIEAINALK